MENYYVYHLINPTTLTVFYVGKGTKNRCYQHLKDTLDNTHNKRLWGYINNLRISGYEPIVFKLQEGLSETYAYDLEELEIKKYGRKGFDEGGILMNIADGGNKPPSLFGEMNGFYGKTHTEEVKDILRKQKIGKPNPKSDNAKRNIKEAAFGYWSKETEEIKLRKEKLGIQGKKYWEGSEEEIEFKKEKLRKLYEKRYKIVYPDGTEEIIINLKQACIDKNFNHSSVYKVLNGKRSHHKGCKFYKVDA